ncbi:MAG: hypothetical protein ABI457_01555 [Hyphomicrobium sp.]
MKNDVSMRDFAEERRCRRECVEGEVVTFPHQKLPRMVPAGA